MRIAVISDTHGLLRPEAVAHLRGVELIIHAGDIGSAETLAALRALGPPLVAVRGNVDRGPWAQGLPETATVDAGGCRLLVLHDRHALDFAPPGSRGPGAAGFAAVISGHSHRPGIERGKDGVLYLNPGAAGPRRFRLPISMAWLEADASAGILEAGLVELVPLRPNAAPP